MASRHQVTCINKIERMNPHERIVSVGGRNADGTRWKLRQEEAISAIEQGKYEFFVLLGGYEVDVIVSESRFGNKYIRTRADRADQNNLLSLDECQL